MYTFKTCVLVCALVGLLAGPALAVTIDTVPVGDPDNAGELSGSGAGGDGPDRICGSVSYTYNIGKCEVTAGQYTEFLNKVAGVDTYGLYSTSMWSDAYGCKIERYAGSGTVGDPYQYRVDANRANRPVNFVSYWDSCRFANWLHNGQPTGAQGSGTTETGAYTLTTDDMNNNTVVRNTDWKWAVTSEDEWYKAAYYKSGSVNAGYFDYPTSSDTVPGRDLADVSGNNANYYYNNPFPIDSPYYTTVAGQFQNSDSPYGTFDQGGNVGEWNEAVVYGAARSLRGGSFVSAFGVLLLASQRGAYASPTYENYGFGFRVSEVPEPTSLALVALGGVGMLIRRRGLGS